MIFAHDTQVALQTAAELINTDDPEGDQLCTPADLQRFYAEWRWTGALRGTKAELEQVRALRPRLRHVWTAPETEAIDELNELLALATAPQLVRHDEWDWHLHATMPDQPVATRMAVEAALGVVDLIRSQETARLRSCEADDCARVYVDLSRNRSRRYCDVTCSNRMSAAAYRARQGGSDD